MSDQTIEVVGRPHVEGVAFFQSLNIGDKAAKRLGERMRAAALAAKIQNAGVNIAGQIEE